MTEYEEDLHTLDDFKPPTDDLYKEGHGLRTLAWQSYLKDDKGGAGKGCSWKDAALWMIVGCTWCLAKASQRLLQHVWLCLLNKPAFVYCHKVAQLH